MAKYKTQRGVETDQRPYRDLDIEEREEICRDWLANGSVPTLEKWNISRQTLEHVKYHHKELIAEIEDEKFAEKGL